MSAADLVRPDVESRPALPRADGPNDSGDVRHSLARRGGDWLTVAAVTLTPLQGFGVGDAVTGVAFADVFLILALVARGYQFLSDGLAARSLRRQSFLLGLLGLFFASGLVSDFVNGTPLSFGYVNALVAVVGAVFLVATYGDGRRVEPRLVQAFVLGCSVLAVSSFVGGFPVVQGRSIGLSVHPNALGQSCLLGFAASAWLIDNMRVPKWRAFGAGAAILTVAGLLRSGSRGGFLGLLVLGFAYLVLRRDVRMVLLAFALAWIGGIVLVTGVVELPASNPVQRLVQEGTENSGSNQARREEFDKDYGRITDHPVFGEGFSDIVLVHAVYMQAWIAAGAVGAATFGLLGMIMVAMPTWQRRQDLALSCGLAGIALTWAFTNIFSARDQWVFIAITFGASASPLVLVRRRGTRSRPTA